MNDKIIQAKLDIEQIDDNGQLVDKLNYFPVFIRKNSKNWAIDDDSWFATSWLLSKDQWAIVWSQEVPVQNKMSEEVIFEPMFGPPHSSDLKDDSFIVKHDKFGIGIAKSSKRDGADTLLEVEFDGKLKWVSFTQLSKREVIQSLSNEPEQRVKVNRLFYICKYNDKCRLIHFIKRGNNLFVKNDFVDSRDNVNDFILGQSKIDECFILVKANCSWKNQPASEKQVGYLNKLISWGKVDPNIDVDNLSKGKCGALIDQSTWFETIMRHFSTSKKENLIG